MNILRLARRVPPVPGGQERHVLELSLEQARLGHKVTVLYAEGDLAAQTEFDSVRLPTSCSKSQILRALAFSWQEVRWVQCERPLIDLIHVHGDFPDAFGAVLLRRLLGVPAVATLHGSWGASASRYDPLRRLVFSRLDHIFGVAGRIERDLRRVGVHTPISIQHSGTRLGQLQAMATARSTEPLVLAVGRLDQIKGYDVLIEAVRLLAPHWPELHVVIAGDGRLGEPLRRQASDLSQIEFAGHLARDNVYRLLHQAWLLVQPSRELGQFTEGTPTAIVEAQAAGLPVVASRVGGISGIVTDGLNGLLVEPDQPALLAAAIEALLADEALRMRFGEAGLAAAQAYDWPHVAQVFTARSEAVVADCAAGRAGGAG